MFRKPKKYFPEEYDWSYDWGVEIDNSYNPERWDPAKICVSLSISKGTSRSWKNIDCGVDIPPEIARHESDRIQKAVEERYRVAHLSPEEKQRKLDEALVYLTGPKNKGFIALRI
jgi:hypothetical protein